MTLKDKNILHLISSSLFIFSGLFILSACSTGNPGGSTQIETTTKVISKIESTSPLTDIPSASNPDNVVSTTADSLVDNLGKPEIKVIEIDDIFDQNKISEENKVIKSFEGFSDLYLPSGYAPINSDDEIMVLHPSSEGTTVGLLNIKTSEFNVISTAEPGYSFMYSGEDDTYIVAYRYSLDINAYPVPLEYIIYDRESDNRTVLDISAIQKASGAGYIHSYVSIFNGVIYLEIQDRGIARNDDGVVINFGDSIYAYDIEKESLLKIRDSGSSPMVNENGLYFKDFSSDGDSGSLYFIESSKMLDEESIPEELVKNCGEYFIHGNKIFYTLDSDNNEIYSYKDGRSELVFT